MQFPPFAPPWFLQSGLLMTLYVALGPHRRWQHTLRDPEPPYQEHFLKGSQGVPLYGWLAIPPQPRGTVIATYGITGSLHDQGLLRALGRKAYARGYAVLLFDWRAHGRSAQLSPTLTSDGIHEGPDFVELARQARVLGCPDPIWLMGYSLGGQLALWGIHTAQQWQDPIAGGVALCPNVDGDRSLRYLMAHPLGRYLEKAIVRNLRQLATQIQGYYPHSFDLETINSIQSIWDFDQKLVIGELGFDRVEDYYHASSPLPWLKDLQKPTLIIYAADDPMFDPALIPVLQAAAATHPHLDLLLTEHGGHGGYLSNRACQRWSQDRDPWWAWNRALDWIEAQGDG